MVGSHAQGRVIAVGLRAFLQLFEAAPRSVQQAVTPLGEPFALVKLCGIVIKWHLGQTGYVERCQALAAKVIKTEVSHRNLQVVSKSAAFLASARKAVHGHPQEEILSYLFSVIVALDQGEQIAANGPRVALDKFDGIENERPYRWDLAQFSIGVVQSWFHQDVSSIRLSLYEIL